MIDALIVLGLALTPALLVALYRRLGDLPLAVSAAAQRDRARTEARTQAIALDSMAEAVAAKSGQAVIATQSYQEQTAESLRCQIAEAETRARVAERRAAEAVKALSAAAELVRELHGALDTALGLARELRELHLAASSVVKTGPDPAPGCAQKNDADSDDGERKTTEVPGPPSHEGAPAPPASTAEARSTDRTSFDDSDETMVAGRAATLPTAPRRRLVPVPPAPPAPHRSPIVISGVGDSSADAGAGRVGGGA
jgi:hypothetical protein